MQIHYVLIKTIIIDLHKCISEYLRLSDKLAQLLKW